MQLLPLAVLAFLAVAVPARAQEAEDGHARMIALLREVHEESLRTNVFLGTEIVGRLEQKLADASAPLTPAARHRTLSELAREELRVGQVEDAVEHATEALELLLAQGSDVPPKLLAEARFALGVACMRLGEVANCCNRRTPESCILPIRGEGVHEDRTGSLRAIEQFEAVLALVKPEAPIALKARWALNLAHMTIGEWPEGVDSKWRIAPPVFASDEDFPRFPEVARQRGVDAEGLAGGAIAEDFDGDGRLDLMTSDSDTDGRMRLWLRSAQGGWNECSDAAGLGELRGGLNMTQADYDGDGDVDVLVLRGAWWQEHGRHPNSLLRNDGSGRFRDVTFAAGLGESHHPTQTAGWADYDHDGDLDLYVGNEWSPTCPSASQLFQNQGDGTFRDVAQAAGVLNERYAKGVAWGDFDEDGWPDLYVSNMAGENRLYRNRGDGSFEDVARAAGVERPWSAFGCIAWDYDQDGHLDLWVAGYGSAERPPNVADVAASYLGLPHRSESARLYQGDGKGGFVEVAERRGLGLATLPMGHNCGDLDNDGFPDLYLATGYPLFEGLIPNVMYRNLRGAGFAEVTVSGGFGHLQKGHAVAFADLDDDGDQDVFTRMGGAYPGDAYGNLWFENPGFGNHWLKVQLVGVRSNRFGVGARIAATFSEGGVERTVHRTVGTGGSFGGNPMRQELGLGAAVGKVRLRVTWPTSGCEQIFEDVPLDATLRIVEFATAFERAGP
jgi:hypothetical protein